MADKLLQSLNEDSSDSQKPISCMPGIFEAFDRNEISSNIRITDSHRSLRHVTGHSQLNNAGGDIRSNFVLNWHVSDVNLNGNHSERQRSSRESARTSFSSSRSSSFSSIDYYKTTQTTTSSLDGKINSEGASGYRVAKQATSSQSRAQQPFDLRDIVKDSMHREARGLSLRGTDKDKIMSHTMQDRIAYSRNCSLPSDFKESFRVHDKRLEEPRQFNDAPDSSKLSSKSRADYAILTLADKRDVSHLYSEMQKTVKSNQKVNKLHRQSVGNLESSMLHSDYMLDRNTARKTSERKCPSYETSGLKEPPSYKTLVFKETLVTHKRPTGVVAKLMGLDAFPDSPAPEQSKLGKIKISDVDTGSRSVIAGNMDMPVQLCNSPRNSRKDSMSPRWRNNDVIMRPTSVAKNPIEPAPWKMMDLKPGSSKSSSKHLEAPYTINSVYSEIEKKMKDLEFIEAGKDLQSLKQIMEAIHPKVQLHTKRDDQSSNFEKNQEHVANYSQLNHNTSFLTSDHKDLQEDKFQQCNSSRAYNSPIVIIKPATANKASMSSSFNLRVEVLSNQNRHKGSDVDELKNISRKYRSPKLVASKNCSANHPPRSSEKIKKPAQTIAKPKQLPNSDIIKSPKSSLSESPKVQQRKIKHEKQARLLAASTSEAKSRRPNPVGRKLRKSVNLQQSDDKLSEASAESRSLSFQDDDSSIHSGECRMDFIDDTEVASRIEFHQITGSKVLNEKAKEHVNSGIQQHVGAFMSKQKSSSESSHYGILTAAELATGTPEHPSPVSVLDSSVYGDESPTALNQFVNNHEVEAGDSTIKVSVNEYNLSSKSGLTSEKFQNIGNLVQKLTELNSTHDETNIDYIASLCDNTDPDHRYISEILLASGLLLRDLGSNVATMQIHSSGRPINPDLYLVLEQTKSSKKITREDQPPELVASPKLQLSKCHRKLIFDTVNEILAEDVLVTEVLPYSSFDSKLATSSTNGQKLLRDLCSRIEHLQAKEQPQCSIADEEDDGVKGMLTEDLLQRTGNWACFSSGISSVVLDMERLFFKDLINEIVLGETESHLESKTGPCSRRLFANKENFLSC